ncbi:hypothetical protein M2175_007530 [Bradyrhizobium elkanii]|nr:hypothetical protein [Bradyrhizobium barranii]MCS3932499.1 hypothetical protein [Bradyrhizobium elkanii]MCS3973057.1 hypothetical protein [Bradyrhizobium japonicum]
MRRHALITGELVDLYKRRARRLHVEARRTMWRVVWGSLRRKS